jgi:phosphate transport system protein
MLGEGFSQHISRQYNLELDEVKTHLLEMGGVVEKQVAQAIESLIEGNSALAQDVCDADKSVNTMEVSIDEECARILARRQPAAGDLRLVIAIGKLNADLERVGDEAAIIARQAIQLSENGAATKGYVEIRLLGERVSDMLHNALDAFARLDTQLALSVAREVKFVDREYNTAMGEMVSYIMEDPRQVMRSLNVIWALRSLERVGDHARNIAEYVIYLVMGKDVRYIGLTAMAARVHEKISGTDQA